MKTCASVAIALLLAGAAACRRAPAGEEEDVLPGHSRPVLDHGWPHPRDLQFQENGFRQPDPQAALVTTASGLRAYVIPAEADRLVEITAAFPLGRAFERAGEMGAAELAAGLIRREISERLGDAFPSRPQVDQDVDLTRVSVQVLPENWQPALAAVLGALRSRELDASGIAAYRTGPGYARESRGVGGAAFRPAVELARLTAGYPVAPPDPNLTVSPGGVLSIASRALAARSIVIGVGGKVARPDVERMLREQTEGWPPAPAEPAGTQSLADRNPPTAVGAQDGPDVRVRTIDEPGFTTWIAIGHALPTVAPEHEAALAVMTEILNIRLNIATREMRGLANQTVLGVTASVARPGLLHVRTGGRPESVAPLIRFATEELSRSREARGLATTDELEQAKGGLVLSKWQQSLDGAGAASATYAIETVRRGSVDRLAGWPAAVRAVTAEDVRAVAEHYIQPDRLQTVIVGQLEAVRQARHPRWPVTLEEATKGQGSRP